MHSLSILSLSPLKGASAVVGLLPIRECRLCGLASFGSVCEDCELLEDRPRRKKRPANPTEYRPSVDGIQDEINQDTPLSEEAYRSGLADPPFSYRFGFGRRKRRAASGGFR